MTRNRSWLVALNEVAQSHGFSMPRFDFDVGGMGAATSDSIGDRFVTLKHRLDVRDGATPVSPWVQWSLWYGDRDRPGFAASFDTPSEPSALEVSLAFPLLRGWLFDGWSPEKTLEEVRTHPGFNAIEMPNRPRTDRREYWLSEDKGFGFVVRSGSWDLVIAGETLAFEPGRLQKFCGWLATVWDSVAFGGDVRPPAILVKGVSAAEAYAEVPADDPEMKEWWGRHAVRAADPGLPDLFFERQADDLLVSRGENVHVFRAAVAVPVLRSLVEAHSEIERIGELLKMGYRVVNRYNSTATRDWLQKYRFSDRDARELADTGVSTHPIVGLLRSGQGSSLSTGDYEAVFGLLKKSGPKSYANLLALAKGLDKRIDPVRPWESGYELAKSVRERLKILPFAKLDVETLARELGVDVQDAVFQDESVLGVCVGTPAHAPLVVLNTSCPDAKGPSGRRMTLAHELDHLLFDRGNYRHLARFEGARAVGDRLMEMRANAFAIELLVPMINLSGVTEERLGDFAKEWQASTHALVKHLENYRKRGER